MIRSNPIPNARKASALSALAVAVGLMLIAAAPARADHVEHAFAHHLGRVAASHFLLAGELFYGAPVPPPVVVHREVVYERPVVYQHPVVYERPYYTEVRHVHRHYDGCGHGGGGHGRGHGKNHRKHHRGDWDHGHRGRY